MTCTIRRALQALGYEVDDQSSTFSAIVSDPDLRRVVENVLAAVGGVACTSQLSAVFSPLAAGSVWGEISNLYTAIVANPAGTSLAASVVVTGCLTTFFVLRHIIQYIPTIPLQNSAVSSFMTSMGGFLQRLQGRRMAAEEAPTGDEEEVESDRSDPVGQAADTPTAPPMHTSTPYRPAQPQVILIKFLSLFVTRFQNYLFTPRLVCL